MRYQKSTLLRQPSDLIAPAELGIEWPCFTGELREGNAP
jgi:hypothetical protein